MDVVVGAAVATATLVVFAVVTILFVRVIDRRPGSAPTAMRYLDAIAQGNAEAANRLCDPSLLIRTGLPQNTDRSAFVTDLALAGALERISHVTILRTTRSRSSELSYVYFSFELGDICYSDQAIGLRWTDGAWQVHVGLGELFEIEPRFSSSPPPTVRVRLGREEQLLSFRTASRLSFLAYPATYPLAVSAEGWRLDDHGALPELLTLAPTGGGVLLLPGFRAAT